MDRICEIINSKGEFIEQPFDNLKKGDIFRLFEGTRDKPVFYQGSPIFIATGELHEWENTIAIESETYKED